MDKLRLVPVIRLAGAAGSGAEESERIRSLAEACAADGADDLLLFDCSETDAEREAAIDTIRAIAGNTAANLIVTGKIRRFEDVKKYFYAGAGEVWADQDDPLCADAFAEAKKRFSDRKLFMADLSEKPLPAECTDALAAAAAEALKGGRNALFLEACESADYLAIKAFLEASGVPCAAYVPAIPWSSLKKNADGLVPCIVQDEKSGEVLMMAYMDEAAYNETVSGGRMCYYSRSRQSRWLKGETSGHFQYVKSLTADCDLDTLLAKVTQVGAACHTGSRSCFFNEVSRREEERKNSSSILEEIYAIAEDRRAHPKEGSYTNYLFDKGIDKILKKCGEEATEIVIAAKNPDPEEIKYEIADFLYHVTVLMVEKGVTWEEITEELSRR